MVGTNKEVSTFSYPQTHKQTCTTTKSPENIRWFSVIEGSNSTTSPDSHVFGTECFRVHVGKNKIRHITLRILGFGGSTCRLLISQYKNLWIRSWTYY